MEKIGGPTLFGTKSQAQWLRRILLPFWVCRILLLVLMGVAYIASIYWISQETDIRGGILAGLIVVILLAVLCISLDAVSMILLGRSALKPSAFLIIQIVETLLWTVVIALEAVAAFNTSSKARSFLTWFISAILYASFVGLLAYASLLFYRSRQAESKSGAYALTQHQSGSDHSLQRQPQNQNLAPTNPFDNAYATSMHSRNTSRTSVASLESVYPAPPPYTQSQEPSRASTPQSSNSFVIITPPEEVADVRNASHNANQHRWA